MHENRETSAVPGADAVAGRPVKDQNRTTGMHAVEESDSGIVARNPSNKGDAPSSAEVGEGAESWASEAVAIHRMKKPSRRMARTRFMVPKMLHKGMWLYT